MFIVFYICLQPIAHEGVAGSRLRGRDRHVEHNVDESRHSDDGRRQRRRRARQLRRDAPPISSRRLSISRRGPRIESRKFTFRAHFRATSCLNKSVTC